MPRQDQTALDVKRSALAVAMVMLRELDEAVPEEHGAQAVAALMLSQKRDSHGLAGVTDDPLNGAILAVTGAIGRLLDTVDDKCPDGPLKPMLLFKIVEQLAGEDYDLDSLIDFVRRAHAGGTRTTEATHPFPSAPRSASVRALGA